MLLTDNSGKCESPLTFFKNVLTISHSLWIYIVVDIFLYSYTLPINHYLIFYQAYIRHGSYQEAKLCGIGLVM